MKKYLFLLFLFCIYILLIIFPKADEVVSYNNVSTGSVVNLSLEFENGINSMNLNNLLNSYDEKYLIKKINIEDTNVNVLCDEFNKCVNQIYEQMNSDFEQKYLISGFKISSIDMISDKDYITNFFDNKNITYSFE